LNTLGYEAGMDDLQLIAVAVPAVLVVAFLYSSVGHAGASGYIATMTLLGFATVVIKPTALILNILVATIGAIQFGRAGHFSWSLFWPFALLSVPAAFIGGYLKLPVEWFKVLVGVVLLCSAVRLVVRQGDPKETRRPPKPVAIACGAVIGLLSGLTGTGGGIFLTPLMLFARWAYTKQVAAVSVLFILLNSIAGLIGFAAGGQPVPPVAGVLGAAAVAGGAVGSYLGSARFPVRTIQWLLAVVLLIAGTKLTLLW
jgi:uncharacterized membrane protein YfcA